MAGTERMVDHAQDRSRLLHNRQVDAVEQEMRDAVARFDVDRVDDGLAAAVLRQLADHDVPAEVIAELVHPDALDVLLERACLLSRDSVRSSALFGEHCIRPAWDRPLPVPGMKYAAELAAARAALETAERWRVLAGRLFAATQVARTVAPVNGFEDHR